MPGESRLRDDAQEFLPEGDEPDADWKIDLLRREAWLLLPEPDDPNDLDAMPGGWWEGCIDGYAPYRDTPMFDFTFIDDNETKWRVPCELLRSQYDPYYDPMSPSVPWSWYLLEQ